MAEIIVISKDPSTRKVLRQVLEDKFHQVVDFDDGLAAIEYHQFFCPVDLVMVDMVEQEQAGIDAIMDFHRDYPELKILALVDGNGAVARGLGADDVFDRKCKGNDLRMKLEGLLSEVYLP